MSHDNRTVFFDLDSSWNITSHPTSHALSDGTSVGHWVDQAVSTEAVPVAPLLELDVHRSELWEGRWQEWGIPNQRDALGAKPCIWLPGLDITVGSGLYLQTFMRHGVTFKTTQQWLLISRNVLCQASLVIHFMFLNANWKSNLLFLVFTCHFVVLTSQHCISKTVLQHTMFP